MQSKTLAFDIGTNVGRWTNANINKYGSKKKGKDGNMWIVGYVN